MTGRSAVVLLTWTPKNEQLHFYEGFNKFALDPYIMIDNDDWCSQTQSVGQIQIDANLCAKAGFKHLNPVITERIKSPASAWEKALYFFSVICTHYDYVWFLEDDVFIPQYETLVDMDKLFNQDLLCADNKINWDGETISWEWYKSIPIDILPPPWGKSMVCAARLSKNLLKELAEFLYKNRDFSPLERDPQTKKYLFIEYLINTIAIHNKLSIATPETLSTIVWRRDWQVSDLRSNFIYHPIKDVALHDYYRKSIREQQQSNGPDMIKTPISD